MAATETGTTAGEIVELAGLVVRDAERLLGQHARLIRSELRQGLRGAARGRFDRGRFRARRGGRGFGLLMVVHGLHRSTRLPLWGCYGLVGAALAAAGTSLIVRGARRVARIDVVPRETMEALREDLSWIKNQLSEPAS